MSQLFYIHPDNPQPRLISQCVEVLRKGGVIVYPTDSGYALGCMLGEKNAMERICRIRNLDKTIGLRVPSNPIAFDLLAALGEPLMSTTLMLPGNDFAESDPEEIQDALDKVVDLVIHGGFLGQQPTTVIDLTEDSPEVVRVGAGDPKPFM